MQGKKYSKAIWVGRFRGYSGFSVSTREYFQAALKYFPNLKLAPLSILEDNDPLKQYLSDMPPPDDAFYIINHIPTTDPEAQAYFSVFEADHIPDNWIEIFNRALVIMTQSKFCKRIFSKNIDDPSKIHVIPYIIPDKFKPSGKKMDVLKEFKIKLGDLDNKENPFIFGSIFEWIPRKAPERTIKAFIEEFNRDENVILLLRTYSTQVPFIYDPTSPDGKIKSRRPLKEIIEDIAEGDPRVVLIDQVIPNLDEFYRGLNAYISCTAGEGWGQTLTEAMVSGVPTIASRHSGNLDFMNDDNSYLVEVHNWSEIPDMPGFYWKLPKISSIRKIMREVYEQTLNGSETLKTKIQNAIKLKDSLTREKIAPKIYAALKDFIG
ncbi:MAG: glycosyltransferase [Promethearchaeota archaeon]